jgi:hypothetical protein
LPGVGQRPGLARSIRPILSGSTHSTVPDPPDVLYELRNT